MSRSCSWLSLALFVTSLFVSLAVNADKGKIKISLNSRDDGTLSASFVIANATSDLLTKWNLQLTLDAKSEGSGRRLGIRGFLKDIETNELSEFDSMKPTVAENELTKYIYFPEKENPLKIVSRSEWNATNKQPKREKRSKPAEFVIVDGHSYRISGDDYYSRIQNLAHYQLKEVGDMYCNFYIADDGNVFEGLGWEEVNYVRNGGLGPRSLIIGFVKRDHDAAPSSAAVEAYEELVKTAVQIDVLSPDYKLIPYHLLYEYFPISQDGFEKKTMRTWRRYTDDLGFIFAPSSEGVFPIVCREEWNGREPSRNLMPMSTPIEYVVVKHYGARCFSYQSCKSYLKVEERYSSGRDEDMFVNFFIAEDGRAYEVLGWDKTWFEPYRQKKAILVSFLGRFYSYPPNERAMMALQRLLKLGQWIGKVSPNYRIASVDSIYPSEAFIGEKLRDEIGKMYRYSDSFWTKSDKWSTL